jgi:hypothetical protein
VLIVIAILFAGMGIYGLVAPTALVRPFEIGVPTAAGRAEIRAVYGGFGLAIGGLLIAAALDADGIRHGAVIAVAVALAGMALGRLSSRVVGGPMAFYPVWFYFWLEVAASALLLFTS